MPLPDIRAGVSGLTTRGRCFLAAGIACVLSAALLGEHDLVRVGVLLLALPLLAVAVVANARYRLACSRRLDPRRVPVGTRAEVLVRLDNVSRLPTSVLLVEDRLPFALGGRPRFVLDRVEPGGGREVLYPVRSEIRGRFRVGPLTVRLTDPFGFVELERSFAAVDELVVTPVVHALPSVRLGGDWTGSGESRSRALASSGDDDAGTREYRQGDDLRRVHWRSTARVGQLMVRREEQPWQSRALLLLDGRNVAHIGAAPASSFEFAVSAVASIGVHLAHRGYSVRTIREDGAKLMTASPGDVGVLLDSLAIAAPSTVLSLDHAASILRAEGSQEGLVVAVVGALAPDERAALARVRTGNGAAIGILLDTTTWGALPARLAAERRADLAATREALAVAGWRVTVATADSSLPDLWRELALTRRLDRSQGVTA